MKLDAPTPRLKQSGQSFTIGVSVAAANKKFLSVKSTKPCTTTFTPPSLSAPKKDKYQDKPEASNKPFDDARKIECRTPRGELQDETVLPHRKRSGQ